MLVKCWLAVALPPLASLSSQRIAPTQQDKSWKSRVSPGESRVGQGRSPIRSPLWPSIRFPFSPFELVLQRLGWQPWQGDRRARDCRAVGASPAAAHIWITRCCSVNRLPARGVDRLARGGRGDEPQGRRQRVRSLPMTLGCVSRFLAAPPVLLLLSACAHTPRQSTSARVPPISSAEAPAANPTTDSTREYAGEWETGFETSVFRGCNGSTPAKVWVSLAPGASERARWSDNTGASANTRTYYVRVRGILRGPASHRRLGDGYGHLGGSDYELYVTRVLEVKPPGEPNCLIRR